MTENSWEQQIISELAQDYIKEKRRKRRYGIFFKSAFLIVTLISLVSLFSVDLNDNADPSGPHTALIDINGPIFADNNMSAEHIVKGLRLAFETDTAKAILLRIDSPGGSPVQAHYVYNEIKRLQHKYPEKKVYAVCVETCASAAYYIAAAADSIYADQASIVGSIGVIYNGFGFSDIMSKVGVDRRVITAGTHKAFLDPFSPKNPQEETILKNMLATVHEQFKAAVLAGRGKRLANNPELFSGLFWLGAEAQKLGLVDGLASPGDVTRNIIKQEDVVDYTVKQNYLEKLAERFSTLISDNLRGETRHNHHIQSILL